MADPLSLFLGVLLVQVPLAVYVHVDAKRRGLENAEWYDTSVLAPMIGLAVFAYYVSRRNSLAGRETNAAAALDRE
ncbi:hypothetical protein [Natronolimnohabitans innermongolicus]|uniref:Uncharacterized protein n=1 Tax=Natronolimnohabitans innermongolicus JCM 12255 TaxID=1227499 RepID=L9WW92_9EURY|nr:hypothetical protein [Natronolimnohabitans innermongolicus]ELY53677.1 hypothetical protein C493_13798 [Natronolimnohabitans innermongolicus JCM 12255]